MLALKDYCQRCIGWGLFKITLTSLGWSLRVLKHVQFIAVISQERLFPTFEYKNLLVISTKEIFSYVNTCTHVGEGIVLEVDRFDPGRLLKGSDDLVPTASIPGDVAIPCQVSDSLAWAQDVLASSSNPLFAPEGV